MVASGDLYRAGSTYRLSERLLERQRRQDAAISPRTRPWVGQWEVAVLTASGRGPADRAQTRADLTALRLAELREGVWLRPDNLDRPWPGQVATLVERLTARPEQPAATLAAALWPLDAWATTGRALLDRFTAASGPGERFALAAAIVRHLVTDSVLPDELLPPGWPAAELRQQYAGYQHELTEVARSAVHR
jgi:phenylacetic acid degradation operon negative regulatory protein